MNVYLYALVDGLDTVSGFTGIAGEPLLIVTLQDISAVAGTMPVTPAVNRQNLAAQDVLVRGLHARAAALLPMRFGASFPTVADAERGIKTMSAGLKERLERARGREQMTVRVLGGTRVGTQPSFDPSAEGVGLRYLAARAARAIPPEIAPILAALQPLQFATRVEPGRQSGLVATVYQLIERGTADDYRRVAEGAAAMLDDLTVRITGPAPCYAFA